MRRSPYGVGVTGTVRGWPDLAPVVVSKTRGRPVRSEVAELRPRLHCIITLSNRCSSGINTHPIALIAANRLITRCPTFGFVSTNTILHPSYTEVSPSNGQTALLHDNRHPLLKTFDPCHIPHLPLTLIKMPSLSCFPSPWSQTNFGI